MKRKLKVYRAHNLDGVNNAIVAAYNLAEAATAMNTTQHQLRTYGYQVVTDPETVALATSEPGEVWYRPIHDNDAAWSKQKRR